jgi:hypothetical protein
MKWVLVLSIVAVLFFLLSWWGAKPIYYRHVAPEGFSEFTESLLAQGGHGTLLFFRHEGSPWFVQFAKCLAPKRMIHFAFPDAPWSRDFYEPVQSALAAAGYRCGSRDTGNDRQTRRFLCIDDIWTAEQAAEIARVAFSGMGLSKDAKYTVHLEGTPSLAEWKRHVRLLKRSD